MAYKFSIVFFILAVLLFISGLVLKYRENGVTLFFVLIFSASLCLMGCAVALKIHERKLKSQEDRK